jgi:diaminopimelate decarboxylase
MTFTYKSNSLHASILHIDDTDINTIVDEVSTPCYIYSKQAITDNITAYQSAFSSQPHLIAYAVKANSNIAILQHIASLGCGFDVVSIGELKRVIHAGGDPKKVVFSGVAKTRQEIEYALSHNIYCFNVESLPELHRINTIAEKMNVIAPVSLRVNPDIDAKTHPYISTGLKDNKFGIPIDDAFSILTEAPLHHPHVRFLGIDCHIGSQLTSITPFVDALKRVLTLFDLLNQTGIVLEHIDLGGGLGVRYHDETPPEIHDYIYALIETIGKRQIKLILEPGRSIVANAGLLITRVEFIKKHHDKHFAIVDAAMNDLIRPALYQAYMPIKSVIPSDTQGDHAHYDIVGPVCETGDFLGKNRALRLKENDLLAVFGAGAYGFVMSSNYNSRPRVPEVLVDGKVFHVIRKRETHQQLWSDESLLPDDQ